MKIIILGAGRVGSVLAEHLSREDNDVTVVDIEQELLHELQTKIDIRTVVGWASHPHILEKAGAFDTDIIIAVTANDEVNMAACQVAYTIFKVKTKIARIRTPSYIDTKALFNDKDVPIDKIISPEQNIVRYIKNLIKYPTASQIINLAHNRVKVISLSIAPGNENNKALVSSLQKKLMPDASIVAMYRNNKNIPITHESTIQIKDEIILIAASNDAVTSLYKITGIHSTCKRIIIAGGGNIGERLASSLENDYQVRIIDKDPAYCQRLVGSLGKTLVIEGNVSDKNLLLEENIENTDIFCAVTNNDEDNIMSALLAKHYQAKQSIALVNEHSYIDLIQEKVLNIDTVVSAANISLSSLLTIFRKKEYGNIINAHPLNQDGVEVIETIVAHGKEHGFQLIGNKISDIKLPNDIIIGGIIRGNNILLGVLDVPIEVNDHLIILLLNTRKLSKLKAFFQHT